MRNIKLSLGFLLVKMRSQPIYFFLQRTEEKVYQRGREEGKVESPRLILRIRRSHLVEDALRQLAQVEDADLSKTLVVQ